MKPVYRLARVESVREISRKYKVDKLWETHKVLELAIADKKREFQISNVSNESVTRSEFEFWIKNLTVGSISFVFWFWFLFFDFWCLIFEFWFFFEILILKEWWCWCTYSWSRWFWSIGTTIATSRELCAQRRRHSKNVGTQSKFRFVKSKKKKPIIYYEIIQFIVDNFQFNINDLLYISYIHKYW